MDRRNFAVPSGAYGFYSPSISEERTALDTIRYDCPQMEPILKPTSMDVLCIRSRLCRSFESFAGYTLDEVDLVRRAMSKKKLLSWQKSVEFCFTVMKKKGFRDVLQTEFQRKSQTRSTTRMTDFAKHAFNKSHAAAYAVVSYQTAYLKYYYPVEFMAALDDIRCGKCRNKVAEYISRVAARWESRSRHRIITVVCMDFLLIKELSASTFCRTTEYWPSGY